MTRLALVGLFSLLLGCHAERPEPPWQEAPATPIPATLRHVDTLSGGDVLVTETDSFVHKQTWSRTDSLIGAFIKLGYKRDGATVTSAIALPAQVQLGHTTGPDLRSLLGTPASTRQATDTILIEYASPFIGPDESVVFHLVADTLRQVSWGLFGG